MGGRGSVFISGGGACLLVSQRARAGKTQMTRRMQGRGPFALSEPPPKSPASPFLLSPTQTTTTSISTLAPPHKGIMASALHVCVCVVRRALASLLFGPSPRPPPSALPTHPRRPQQQCRWRAVRASPLNSKCASSMRACVCARAFRFEPRRETGGDL